MIRNIISFVIILLVPVYSYALKIEQAVPEFSAINADGKQIELSDFKGKKVVLEWTNHKCPFVKKHYQSDNMQATQAFAKENDVVWLSVISSAPGKQGHVDGKDALHIANTHRATPTDILLDESGELGKLFGAKTTPHMYIIDEEGLLQYKGAIDSKASANPSDIQGATNYVKQALSELLSDQKVSNPSTRPYGCSVKYKS